MLSVAADEIDDAPARGAGPANGLSGSAWATDAAGRLVSAPAAMLALLGMTTQDLQPGAAGRPLDWRLLAHPDDGDAAAASWRLSLDAGHPCDMTHRLRAADGSHAWIRSTACPVRDARGQITAWYGTSIAAPRDRERELSQLVDLVPSHVWRLAPDGEPIFYNKRAVDYLGHGADGAPGGLNALIASVHPDDAAAFRDAIGRSLATGQAFALRYRLRRADGVYRWLSSRAEPVRDQAGRIQQWYGVCHDIDDQVRAEEALQRREQEFERLVDAVPAMIWCVTPDGRPSYINRRLADVVGLELGDLIGRDGAPSLADIHPDDMPAVGAALGHALKTGEAFSMTYRQRRADGGYRWTEGRAEPLRGDAGTICHG